MPPRVKTRPSGSRSSRQSPATATHPVALAHATARTAPASPRNSSSPFPDSTSHRRSFPSSPAERTADPSGVNATPVTGAGVTRSGPAAACPAGRASTGGPCRRGPPRPPCGRRGSARHRPGCPAGRGAAAARPRSPRSQSCTAMSCGSSRSAHDAPHLPLPAMATPHTGPGSPDIARTSLSPGASHRRSASSSPPVNSSRPSPFRQRAAMPPAWAWTTRGSSGRLGHPVRRPGRVAQIVGDRVGEFGRRLEPLARGPGPSACG